MLQWPKTFQEKHTAARFKNTYKEIQNNTVLQMKKHAAESHHKYINIKHAESTESKQTPKKQQKLHLSSQQKGGAVSEKTQIAT